MVDGWIEGRVDHYFFVDVCTAPERKSILFDNGIFVWWSCDDVSVSSVENAMRRRGNMTSGLGSHIFTI